MRPIRLASSFLLVVGYARVFAASPVVQIAEVELLNGPLPSTAADTPSASPTQP